MWRGFAAYGPPDGMAIGDDVDELDRLSMPLGW
jgi:hypothetical protein